MNTFVIQIELFHGILLYDNQQSLGEDVLSFKILCQILLFSNNKICSNQIKSSSPILNMQTVFNFFIVYCSLYQKIVCIKQF